jgi:hypothetical protein
MSREEIETGLQKLSQQEAQFRGETTYQPTVSKAQLVDIDIPRSEPRTFEVSVLPKSGEEVLPSQGTPHPIVELLRKKQTMTPSLPIVERPIPPESIKTEPLSVPEKIQETSILSGISAPAPSPTIAPPIQLLEQPNEHVTPQVFESHIRSHIQQRNVLFLYPPAIDINTIIECYKYAAKTVLHPEDKLTILWASDAGSGQTQGRTFVTGESISSDTREFQVTAENFEEVYKIPPPLTLQATATIRTKSPCIHRLITETDISGKSFQVKLQPHANLHWTVQQELQKTPEGKLLYDMVVMPCLRPEQGSDAELEKFLLENSSVPVVLLRSP